jgi:UDP-N-acetylglucosamine 2-epimerase (non-hydrolysing)
MRDVTERPEGVAAGVAKLVGTTEAHLVETALALLRDRAKYAAMTSGTNPYGDGHAAQRIAQVLEANEVETLRLVPPSSREVPATTAS